MGLIWTGGMFDPESDNYQNFVMAFSDASDVYKRQAQAQCAWAAAFLKPSTSAAGI